MSKRVRETPHNVVVILEKAGLWLGNDGLVDPYDRANTTAITNESLADIRPDIVHQCLLALYDSDLAASGRLRVYIVTVKGKTIQVNPSLRPPRTYHRFKGLMESLLRSGSIVTSEGETLMKVLPGSVAPIIPNEAPVIGICHSNTAPVHSPSEIAQKCMDEPVSDELQGGLKSINGFFVIPCTEETNLDGIDYVTKQMCLSLYPTSAHVMCARVCEGFARQLGKSDTSFCNWNRTEKKQDKKE
eukprot:GILI01026539.1.p1 GENE.GILI01026539.1~~GILI01026539.1.p1  ORF type:complete len:244 (+),score=43.46 GILI01026539.1:46-777(+)